MLLSTSETAEARDILPPSQDQVVEMCKRSEHICDISEVETTCKNQRDWYEKTLASNPYVDAKTLAVALANKAAWPCRYDILDDGMLCSVSTAEIVADNNHTLTASEVMPILSAPDDGITDDGLGYKTIETAIQSGYKDTITHRFCPIDANMDGVISLTDDSNGDGVIDGVDRAHFRK